MTLSKSEKVLIPPLTDRVVTNRLWMEHLQQEEVWEVAHQLADLPVDQIVAILYELPQAHSAAILCEISPELQGLLFEKMSVERIALFLQVLAVDDAADLLVRVSAKRIHEVLQHLPLAGAEKITEVLRYPEDSAGGIMDPTFVAVHEGLTVQEAIQKLQSDASAATYGLFYVYAIDEVGRLCGVLRLRDLLFSNPEVRIRALMITTVQSVSVHADQETIASLFRDHDFTVIPVIDDFQRLRGVVTSHEVMQVMDQEATEDMQRMIGLSGEEMIDTPWKLAFRNRIVWLYVNLATALLAGWVVSLYESTIGRYAVLAVFLPVIASQGGNAGIQTLTIMVRELALGHVRNRQKRRILMKECLVAALTGCASGIVVGCIAYAWRGNGALALVAGLAMMLNMMIAVMAGVMIPLGLKVLRIDPALASSIMLTTVTDVVGFFLFLGLATIGFHYLQAPA